MKRQVAIVLHAHLPYVRHRQPYSAEERWLHEAIWECYLPLLDVLQRLAGEGVPSPLTLSVSPPLGAMLADSLLQRRFAEHLQALWAINERQRRPSGPFAAVASFYQSRLRQARASWERCGGDILGALVEQAAAGRLELLTSGVSHAYLPGLVHLPGAVEAQIRLGRRAFAAAAGSEPGGGMWLPECAFVEGMGRALAAGGLRYTVLDGHGLRHARPRPADFCRPLVDHHGVAYFGRDREATQQVWSRARGYPGDPWYREFHRDLGHELSDEALQPLGRGTMTGLKYHRITGHCGQAKLPYEPAAAAARAAEHAHHFAAILAAGRGLCVVAFDAELFGHWWFEGPLFLEHLLRELGRRSDVLPVTLGGFLDAHPRCPQAEPASSSWGEGGFGVPWVGPRTARFWRHLHAAYRQVGEAVARHRQLDGLRGRVLDQAIRELLLALAGDWLFLIHQQTAAAYAEERLRLHLTRVHRLLAIIAESQPCLAVEQSLTQLTRENGFLTQLSGAELREPLGLGGD